MDLLSPAVGFIESLPGTLLRKSIGRGGAPYHTISTEAAPERSLVTTSAPE
jgi:hypothetical protein